MKELNETIVGKTPRDIKIIQFGEGNFLRAFVDYMFDILNEKSGFDGGIAIVKPIKFGSVEQFAKQDNLYTVLLRGLSNGKEVVEKRVVTSIEKAISCYDDYEDYSSLARLSTLKFVVSNTTEAGIVLDLSDEISLCPPNTYPGKLTKFLFERYTYFNGSKDSGLIILPVELIDNNGKELKKCVEALAEKWELGKDFLTWLNDSCVFTSTLVDRIVTGYPKDEDEAIFNELGYEDKLIVTGEPFALWVIEAEREISGEIPFDKIGLPVIFTKDHKPYKQRKVRILNGAHTSFVPASYLAGNDYVGESMRDEVIRNFMHDTIFNEVIPTLELPQNELEDFAGAVIDRFENPFIKHSLLAISLNGVSKWRARCLPSFLGYIERFGKLPEHLTFSLAAMIAFYNGNRIEDGALIGNRNGNEYKILDDAIVLEFFKENSNLSSDKLVNFFLRNDTFFGCDLTKEEGVAERVSEYLEEIRNNGMRNTLNKYFG